MKAQPKQRKKGGWRERGKEEWEEERRQTGGETIHKRAQKAQPERMGMWERSCHLHSSNNHSKKVSLR